MYLEAPHYYTPEDTPHERTLFLAGGITDCPDWQAEAMEVLKDAPLTVFNPRRREFSIDDPAAAREQITWEHFHLRMANAILFWFCQETLQPIALYELGAWSMTVKPLAIGTHPDYVRRQDVVIQTGLARPSLYVFDDLTHTIGAAIVAALPWED